MKARLLAALALLVCACLSFGQGMRGTMSSRSEYNTGLLLSPAVQKDIHLSSAVASKLRANAAATNKLLMNSFTIKPGAVDATKIQQNRATMMARMQRDSAAALALLTPAQKTRLREISLQSYGAAGVMLPSVEKQLGITPAQHRNMEGAMQKQMSESMTQWRKTSSARLSAAKMMENSLRTKEKMDQTVLGLLTPAQRAKWKAMLGKPFKMASLYSGIGASRGKTKD